MELRWRYVMAYLLVLLATLVTAVPYNRTAEGYQHGLLSDCTVWFFDRNNYWPVDPYTSCALCPSDPLRVCDPVLQVACYSIDEFFDGVSSVHTYNDIPPHCQLNGGYWAYEISHGSSIYDEFKGKTITSPGSWKPVTISRKNLEKLWISVMNPGGLVFSGYTTYNYYHIHKLVDNPMIDFKNKKTFLYVGGYGDLTIAGPGRFIANMYKEMGYNALVLDTFQFTFGFYPHAARKMRAVGKHTGEMLAQLTKQGLNPKNLTLLGLSLGGETMGFIAKSYQEITGKNISLLIGLDPAGPCYRHLGPKDRLDPSDADFVLMVTTNMDGLGTDIPAGTATFYVNGGEYQPGYIPWLPCGALCSHMLSLLYWVSALYNPGIFVGVQCDSVENARHGLCYDKRPLVTNTMDMAVDKTKPGIYYLPTSAINPYGIGIEGLKQWVNNKGRL